MCIICLEYQKTKDLVDARRMLEYAKHEKQFIDIDERHLEEVESVIRHKEYINASIEEKI